MLPLLREDSQCTWIYVNSFNAHINGTCFINYYRSPERQQNIIKLRNCYFTFLILPRKHLGLNYMLKYSLNPTKMQRFFLEIHDHLVNVFLVLTLLLYEIFNVW